MPSPRRMRLLVVAVVGTLVFMLFYNSGMNSQGRDSRAFQDFYEKTVKAMDKDKPGQVVMNTETGGKAGMIPADRDADGDVDEDDRQMAVEMQGRLKAAEQVAKDKANEKGGLKPDPPSNVIGVGSSAEGQNKKDVADGGGSSSSSSSNDNVQESAEEHQAEQELGLILKKSPVIIFSKSYCPFSKRAKGILLEKYDITPDPHVVELDQHPLGSQLQDQLLERTGRRTVPNIMINGISIGGADELVALDNADNLSAKILELGNKRVEITERFVPNTI